MCAVPVQRMSVACKERSTGDASMVNPHSELAGLEPLTLLHIPFDVCLNHAADLILGVSALQRVGDLLPEPLKLLCCRRWESRCGYHELGCGRGVQTGENYLSEDGNSLTDAARRLPFL